MMKMFAFSSREAIKNSRVTYIINQICLAEGRVGKNKTLGGRNSAKNRGGFTVHMYSQLYVPRFSVHTDYLHKLGRNIQ